MSEHLSTERIARYRQRTMSPAELLTADDHVATCSACRQRLSSEEELEAAYISLRAGLEAAGGVEPSHLSYKQLEGYLDGKLDEVGREIVDSHLEVCPQCKAELDDLQRFAARLKEPRPTFWGRFSAFRRRAVESLSAAPQLFPMALRRAPQYAAALATIIVLAMATGTISLYLRSVRLRTRSVAKRTPPQAGQSSQLQPGEYEIRASSSPQFLLALNDGGGSVGLDKHGNLVGLETLPPLDRQSIKTALTTRRFKAAPILATLNAGTGTPWSATLRESLGESHGESDLAVTILEAHFEPLSPVGTVVESQRPTFRWKPLPGATSYTVAIYDSNFKRIAASQALLATEWRVPWFLERDRVYSWQVTAVSGNKEVIAPVPPGPEAKFKVLDPIHVDELARVRQAYPNSHLALGILETQVGLLDDAEREFQALSDANPESPIAQSLLRSVKALRTPPAASRSSDRH